MGQIDSRLGSCIFSGLPGWGLLDLNQHAPDIDDEAAFHLVMDAAQGAVEVDEIAARLHLVPVTST